MYRRITTYFTIATVLYGCATPQPPYAIPPGIPYANLKSSISGAYGRYESITISVFDKNASPPGDRKLFSIAKSVSTPAGYVKVPANQPVTLTYYESASGGRYCQLFAQVNLEPEKNYSLVGGFEYEKGPIPILTGTRKCKFGVENDTTGLPVSYR
jgi:hypothetical protein